MDIREIKIGTKLELEIINHEDMKLGMTHASQLLEIVNAESLTILNPIHESKYAFIALGTRIRITFFQEKLNSLFFFTATIEHKETRGNFLLLHIHVLSPLQKLQRRNYYRFDCNLNARYRVVPDGSNNPSEDREPAQFVNALTRNISGSGACIVAEEELSDTDHLDVEISLSETTVVKARCKVIRVTEIEASKGKKFEIGLYFTKIPAKGQDDIVKFIFERQRETLKRI